MKKSFFLLMLLSSLMFSSCDEILNPDTQSSVDKLKGIWLVAETSSEFGQQQYQVEFSEDETDSTRMNIYNFFGLGTWSYVSIDVDNQTLTIPSQTEEGYIISGSGTVNEDFTQVNLSFTVEEVVVPQKSVFAVTAVLTKE
ncbi:MAG: hypothetical protein K9I34_02160 [Bacteroidales bacterium]|nr:hypothetical protein [Bacteroidales bacterium]